MKIFNCLQIFLLCALFQPHASAEEASKTVIIGRQKITLPVPEGYLTSEGIPFLQSVSEAFTMPTHRFLMALYPKEDVISWRNGKPRDTDRYLLIQTEKQSEMQLMSNAEFTQLKAALKKHLTGRMQNENKFMETQRTEHQRALDTSISKVRRNFTLPPSTIRLGETVILGLVDEKNNSLSTASATKVSVNSKDVASSATLFSISTVLLVKGKLVNIYGYSNYRNQNDLDWLENSSKIVAAQISGANQ